MITLTALLEKHAQALGGPAALAALTSLQIEFRLVEPDFAVDGLYRAERAGRMRVDIFSDGVRVFTEAYDGTQAWQLPQGAEAVEPVSPAGQLALQHGLENQLFALHELPARGHHLSLEGTEIITGREHAVVKQVFPDGHTLWKVLDLDSGLIVRTREKRALHPDVDPTETTIETRFTDFREVEGGLVRAFREIQVDLAAGRVMQTTSVQRLWVNPAFDPQLFTHP